MQSKVNRLLLSFPSRDDDEDDDEDLPCEFCIFSFGTTSTLKGDYQLDAESAYALMAAAKDYGNRLTIDYEHQALSDPPIPAPAAGSYLLELRADGVYAVDVKWTDKAAAMLRAKEYLYFSPAFTADKQGRPNRLLNVALTNIPATKNMQSLVAANLIQETRMHTVLTALSLKQDSSEAEALSAVTKLSEERKQLLAATGKENVAEAIGSIAALKQQAEKVEALTAELSTIKAEKQAVEMSSLLDEAVRDGQVSKAKRTDVEALAKSHGIEALKGFLAVIPKSKEPAQEKIEAPKAIANKAPSDIEKIQRMTGVDADAMSKHAAKYKAAINPSEEN